MLVHHPGRVVHQLRGGEVDVRVRPTMKLTALAVACLLAGACSDEDRGDDLPRIGGFTDVGGMSTPTLDPNDPAVVGEGPNSFTPFGDNATGIDATDSLCDDLIADLTRSITDTMADMRDAGMPASAMPSRSEIEEVLDDALEANGCPGF
jgi:hypothetical protein